MEQQLIPKGEYAGIQNHNIHIYRTGNEAGPKIIIMSGAGVPVPVFDYKVLYSKLTAKCRIIVIEKFGYGYSDLYECPTDIDSLVSMQKEALESLGEKGPYVLLPHSMSGLEAIRWKQKYPEDVSAIIGLDMAMPAEYKQWSARSMKARVTAMKLVPVLKKCGLLFWYPINTRGLTEYEKQQQNILLKRNLMNVCIMNESSTLLSNADAVAEAGPIKCPTLLFVSNGKQVSKNWVSNQSEFAKEMNAETVYFNCGHCIHYYESETVSRKIEEFVGKLCQ